jgi:hypothetical protein
MERPAGRAGTALITGGSSGIGLALARLFVRDGYEVVLVARDPAKLSDAARSLGEAGARVTTIGQDLSKPGATGALFRQLDDAQIAPAIVVNNAGFGLRGPFATTDPERELAMIQVNVTALTEITKLALGRMLARGSGRILNVASTAAFQPGPLMAVYYATKAYVLSLSEAVAHETRGTGVTVTTLCPGPTATSFEQRAGMTGSRLFKSGVDDADRVARKAYVGLMRGQRLVIPGLRNKLLVQSLRVSPRSAVLAVARWMQE